MNSWFRHKFIHFQTKRDYEYSLTIIFFLLVERARDLQGGRSGVKPPETPGQGCQNAASLQNSRF